MTGRGEGHGAETKPQRSYQREIQRLRRVMGRIEWVQPMYNGHRTCPSCESAWGEGHDYGCELGRILNRVEAGGPR